jgi:hypothetical protein
MAATATTTVLIDGPRNLVVLVNIAGTTGDATNALLIDRSTYAPTDGLELAVERIEGACAGFLATLSFDATADLIFAQLPSNNWVEHDWRDVGGVSSNKSGAGSNGDILLTTSGYTGAPMAGTFTLFMRKS